MREDAKKATTIVTASAAAARELPMPSYHYQQMAQTKGDVRGQSSERVDVQDRKIKSLQNLSMAS